MTTRSVLSWLVTCALCTTVLTGCDSNAASKASPSAPTPQVAAGDAKLTAEPAPDTDTTTSPDEPGDRAIPDGTGDGTADTAPTAGDDGVMTVAAQAQTLAATAKHKTRVTVTEASGLPGSTITLTARLEELVNGSWVPAAGGKLVWTINNQQRDPPGYTNADGIATIRWRIPSSFAKKDYTMTVTYSGSFEREGSTGRAPLHAGVAPPPPPAKLVTVLTVPDIRGFVGQTVSLVGCLEAIQADGTRRPVAKQWVDFTVTGPAVGTNPDVHFSKSRQTEDSGCNLVLFTIPLYYYEGIRLDVDARFLADATYTEAKTRAILEVVGNPPSRVPRLDMPKVYADPLKNATLKAQVVSTGPKNGVPIYFFVNGQRLGPVPTNADGLAQINFSVPDWPRGSVWPISARHDGDPGKNLPPAAVASELEINR